uniref:Uncharacterized protein n=1 Tax=Glossina austeni TaxID=7395 RepID=A0A1A9VVP9_GLOAU
MYGWKQVAMLTVTSDQHLIPFVQSSGKGFPVAVGEYIVGVPAKVSSKTVAVALRQIKAQANTLPLKTSQSVDRDNFHVGSEVVPEKYLCCDYSVLSTEHAQKLGHWDYKLFSGNLTVAYDNISSQHNSLFFKNHHHRHHHHHHHQHHTAGWLPYLLTHCTHPLKTSRGIKESLNKLYNVTLYLIQYLLKYYVAFFLCILKKAEDSWGWLPGL